MDNKITIIVVVNGEPTTVEANLNAPLHTVVNHALAQTNNTGQPANNWELQDGNDNLLDLDKKVSEFDFEQGVTLYLSLKVGVAG